MIKRREVGLLLQLPAVFVSGLCEQHGRTYPECTATLSYGSSLKPGAPEGVFLERASASVCLIPSSVGVSHAC